MPDLVALGAVLTTAGVTAQDVCDTVLVMPGTHEFGSSLTDQYIECISVAQVSGATVSLVLQALLTVGGIGAIAGATAWIVGDGASTPVKPTWAETHTVHARALRSSHRAKQTKVDVAIDRSGRRSRFAGFY
jgi:hypothetical protein